MLIKRILKAPSAIRVSAMAESNQNQYFEYGQKFMTGYLNVSST